MYPQRIVCLTEESVELIFALGLGEKIVGVSAFVKRPKEALSIKRIGAFTSANINKICELGPDLVLGFSDIQKEIAKDLIGKGLNVYIANHRSIDEMLSYCLSLGAMLGAAQKAQEYVDYLKSKINAAAQRASKLSARPRVYIEEWDEPMLCGIRYFSDLIELCGGEDIFRERAVQGSLGMERQVTSKEVIEKDPEIILPCWCGKKVEIDQIRSRPGWSNISAVSKNKIYELEPEVFLQPGPALIESGIDILQQKIFDN